MEQLSQALARRDWTEADLAARRRSDPGKLAIAARRRSETTLPVKWIAARVPIGTTKGAKSWLHHLAHEPPQHQSARMNKADGQLEFQSTVTPFRESSRYPGASRNLPAPTR